MTQKFDPKRFYDALPKRRAELIDGQLIVGGSEATTLEWLGLLLMTLGVKEGVRCLEKLLRQMFNAFGRVRQRMKDEGPKSLQFWH